jgi:peptidyl-prolyl cis-trans isomerase B (cyclophilin B)
MRSLTGRATLIEGELAHSSQTQPAIMEGQAVPSNEQRRASAKRKLERQLERRAQQARRRRTLAIVGGSVAAVVVVAAIVATVVLTNHDDKKASASSETSSSATPGATGAPLPAFKATPELGANCQYPPSSERPAKQAKPPRTGKVPTDPAEVSVSMVTNQGHIGLLLANNESPCTVNNFASLAQQKFFDDTKCHRLTLSILQCGDPSADGTGGPGYQFADEYPVDQYKPGDPAHEPVIYPRGTLAMANSGPNTNGSQFFFVYKDTPLPPAYTVFGKIQQDGLATLDKIAKDGIAGGSEDGPPANEVTVKSVLLD